MGGITGYFLYPALRVRCAFRQNLCGFLLLCSYTLIWIGVSEASNTEWLVGTRKLAVISAISRESGAGANIRKTRVVKINVSFNILSS